MLSALSNEILLLVMAEIIKVSIMSYNNSGNKNCPIEPKAQASFSCSASPFLTIASLTRDSY
jgi:hypothetical protein